MFDKEKVVREVEEALDEIRPYLKADGGNISLVEITEELIVKVRLEGSCHSCPMNLQTLKGGVEIAVKKNVPGILEVVAV